MASVSYIVVRYIRFDDCNVFISALELSTFYLILFPTFLFAFNPQRFVRLHLVGEYVPNFFPLGFWGFRIRRRTWLDYPE